MNDERRLTQSRIEKVVKALPALIGHRDTPGDSNLDSAAMEDLLRDYFRLMEIAYFVRRGGVSAMAYRLETGKTKFSPTDYLDDAHDRLLAQYKNVYKPEERNEGSLLDALRDVSGEEELAVAQVLPRLDDLLLADRRRDVLD